ncbi:hypothetical protein [Oleiphilus messinensis]|uniref:hypothetical protein n=1 Tax=Oleiphilus messinensis TaxID=141451 RepID=UPI000B3B31A9|nr:hypothetical protein [Oleiphilus messinensis]
MVIPAGKLLLKLRLDTGTVLAELSIVYVSVLETPGAIVEGEKAIENVGGAAKAIFAVKDKKINAQRDNNLFCKFIIEHLQFKKITPE